MRYFRLNLKRYLSLISILMIGVACDTTPPSPSGSKGFNLYPVSADIQFGEQVEKEQLKELRKENIPYDTPKNEAMRSRLNGILAQIVRVSDMPSLPYTFHYVEAPVVNAMCAPGGKVFLYEGLHDPKKGLVNVDSDAEFAAVLGHEYAHATMRHVTRQISRYQGISIFGNIASGIVGAGLGAGAQQIFGRLYSFGAMFYFPHYGRKFETEADLVGARYMAKAGYDPQVAATLWRRASEKRKKEGKVDKTNILASHPASGDRAKTLEKSMPEILKYYQGSNK